MGFVDDWKPFFGFRTDKPAPNRGHFNLYERSNATKRKLAVKNVSYLDRRKFLGILKEEGKLNKVMSNRQVIDMLRRRGEPRRFRQRIKDGVLTPRAVSAVDEKQIAKNIRLTTFDRIRDEVKFGENKPYKTGLSSKYNQGQEISPTAKRPGATRNPDQDKAVGNSNIHLPV